MSARTIHCPGGPPSQTGLAVAKRYPKITIVKCGDTIKAIADHFEADGKGPYAVPIWNSHEGEITAAEYVWNYIEGTRIRIADLWPQRIDFWFVRRTGKPTNYKKIGSVKVAKTQCSAFLAKRKTELIECTLTTAAHDQYRQGALWDGVLVGPGQGEGEEGFEVADKATANPNNFTSFAIFSPIKEYVLDKSSKSRLTGVTMPSFGDTVSDAVQAFFQRLTDPISDLNTLPKLIFVLKRTANVGLLLEGEKLHAGDLMDVEDEGGISVHEDVGALNKAYSDELRDLFGGEFPLLADGDFILHQGIKTYLLACPPLGLYTHGYEVNTVEPVVRFYIHKIFQRLDAGAKCTKVQMDFFKRHKAAWQAQGPGFINFTRIDPVGG